MKRFLIGFLLFFFAITAFADTNQLYVSNKLFPGKIFLVKERLYAEAYPLSKMLGVELTGNSKDQVIFSKEGQSFFISSMNKGDQPYALVEDVAKQLGLLFKYNSETKIYDLFARPKVLPGYNNSSNSESPNKYQVTTQVEEQKGIDEMVLYVTLTNQGPAVPGFQVVCQFMDEDRHPIETQTQGVGTLGAGASAKVIFRLPYPHAANTGTYRDYNKNIKYDINLVYPK